MKKTVFLLAVIALVFGACTREQLPPEDVVSPKTILTIGAQTKTTLGDEVDGQRQIYWAKGDQVRVNGILSDALPDDLPAQSVKADFVFPSDPGTPYKTVYPASLWKDENTVTLPLCATRNIFPLAGESGVSAYALRTLTSGIRISLQQKAEDPDTDNIVLIEISTADTQLSGDFTIDWEQAILTPAGPAEGDNLKVRITGNWNISSRTDFFIPVPAGVYSFAVKVMDANGHYMVRTASNRTLEKGTVLPLTVLPFDPSATDTGLEIETAQQLIDFVTAYNSKAYESLGSALMVTLKDDISFDPTTSEAFNATGGIGLKVSYYADKEDYYFDGQFNGNGHTISGLEATTPLFKATASGSQIKNLTLDNSCSFTFTHSKVAELDAGAVVGYHRGTLNNVNVAADVTLAAVDAVNKVTALGGLAGREVVGAVEACSYTGNLTVPDGFVVNTQKTYVGGLVGNISNASGTITGSSFAGTIDFAGTVASTDTSDPYLCLGGIVGNSIGTVSGCTVLGTKTKAIEMDNGTTYTATIQNHSRKAYHLAQGGVAGQNGGTLSDCTNSASTKNFVLTNGTKEGTASDSNSRYYDLGGIVGLNLSGATVTGCTNTGLIESRSTPRIQKVGGVAGYNKGTVSSSSNEANLSFASATGQSPYSLRVGEVGGVIGNNGGTLNAVSNSGNITLSRTENNASVELKFGGVMGITTVAVDGGALKSISNSGNILDSYNGTTVTTDGLRFGGVVGRAQASVKNVTNSGSITYQLSAANVVNKLYMGGIAGELANGANAEISGCNNSGEVYFNVNSKAAAHTGNYVGGIVGYIHATKDGAGATVSDCDNSGYVHLACSSTTACTDLCVGGVIGKTVESGTVTDANNVGGEVALTFSNAAHTDNYAGGVIGKSAGVNITISDCSNSGYVHGGNTSKQNGKTMYVGGIVAYLDGASGITGCTNTGKLLNDQFNNTNTKVGSTFEGGIAGFVLGTADDRIAISNVTNDVTVVTDKVAQKLITGGRRGFTGGAVGYAEYTDITNASNTDSYGGGSGYWIGGIAGWLVNSTVSGSTYSGTSIESSQIQGAGGIVCTLDAGSVIDGCNSYLNSITHGANACKDGAVAALSVTGSTIQNTHYNSTYAICSDTNFTNGGGNVADL